MKDTVVNRRFKFSFIEGHLPTLSLEFSCVARYERADEGFFSLDELKVWNYGLERYVEPNYSETQVIEAYVDNYLHQMAQEA